MGELDEAAWKIAGRLMLLVHIRDFSDGYVSDASSKSRLWHDHKSLTEYGYDMTACRCVSDRNNRTYDISYGSVPNVAQMAARRS